MPIDPNDLTDLTPGVNPADGGQEATPQEQPQKEPWVNPRIAEDERLIKASFKPEFASKLLDPSWEVRDAALKEIEDPQERASWRSRLSMDTMSPYTPSLTEKVAQKADKLGRDLKAGITYGTADAIENTVNLAGDLTGGAISKVDMTSTFIPKDSALTQAPADSDPRGFISGTASFLIGFVGAGKFLKAANLLQKGGKALMVGRAMVQGATADAVVMEPNPEARLSNFVQDKPWLANPITEYLAADPEHEGPAEGRLKNTLEGGVLGVAMEGAMMTVVRGIKQIRQLRAAGKEAEAVKVEADLADTVQTELSKAPETAPATTTTLPSTKVGVQEDIKQAVPDVAGERPIIDAEAAARIARAAAEGKTVDGAVLSNVNIHRVDTPDDVMKVVRQISHEVNNAAGGASIGPTRTFEMVQDEAAALLMKPDEFMATVSELAGKTENLDSTLIALRTMRESAAAKIKDTVDALVAAQGSGNKTLEAQLTKDLNGHIARAASTVDALEKIRGGAARATASGNIATGVTEGGAKANEQFAKKWTEAGLPEELLKQVKVLVDDPEAVIKQITAARKGMNALNELFINNILSGPRTHVVNTLSNFAQTIGMPAERLLGGMVGGDKQAIREGVQTAFALKSYLFDSLKATATALRRGEPVLDATNKTVDAAGKEYAISGKNLLPEGMQDTPLKDGLDWVGKVLNIPSRLMVSQDEFFKQLNYRAMVHGRAAAKAAEMGLNPQQTADFIQKAMDVSVDTIGTASKEVNLDAAGKALPNSPLQYARKATLSQDLLDGTIGKTLQETTIKHPALRLILPFVRTPTNMLRGVGQRTPGLQLLYKEFRDDLAAGGIRAADAKGKMATGAMLWSTAALMASQGVITGGGPKDRDLNKQLKATGWQPYSIKIGDSFYSYQRGDPMGIFYGMAADFAEASGHMSDQEITETAGAMVASLVKNLNSKSYLQGLTNALDAWASPEDKAGAYFRKQAAALVPFSSLGGQLNQEIDGTMREARTTLDAVRAKIPGLSAGLPPQRNILGEKIQYPDGFGPDLLSPIATTKLLKDPVKDEMARLAHAFPLPDKTIGNSGIDLTKFKNKDGQDAYDRWQELTGTVKLSGQTLSEMLNDKMQSKDYKNLSDDVDQFDGSKAIFVRRIIKGFQETAKQQMFKEYPEIYQAYMKDALDAGNVKANKPIIPGLTK